MTGSTSRRNALPNVPMTVRQAIVQGSRQPAKVGRELCRFNFAFGRLWQGRVYAIKQVAPVIAERPKEIVVVTVYTFFF